MLPPSPGAPLPAAPAVRLVEAAERALDARAGDAPARAFPGRAITGGEPAVAPLSSSARGSAGHTSVAKARRAPEPPRQAHPGPAAGGGLPFGAASVTAAGVRRAPGSPATGRANVFTFPRPDAGDIAHETSERLAGTSAPGLTVRGPGSPFHDPSRGWAAAGIVAMALTPAVRGAHTHAMRRNAADETQSCSGREIVCAHL